MMPNAQLLRKLSSLSRPLFAVLTNVVTACEWPTSSLVASFHRPNVAEFVTPEVRAYLDAAGHFQLSLPTSTARPTISPDRARELAAAYLSTFAAPSVVLLPPPGLSALGLRETIEQIHGRGVDWTTVKAAPWSPYYMQSPLQPITDSIPDYLRRHVGPRYHVLFVAGDAVIADVAVSAYATKIVTSEGGNRITALSGGGEFQTAAFPATLRHAVPLIPEAAVEHVARATGAKIAAVPILLGPSPLFGAVFARWRLELDRPITVRRADTGALVSTATLFVGLGPGDKPVIQLHVSANEQPKTISWPFVWPASQEHGRLEARFSESIPTSFIVVRLP